MAEWRLGTMGFGYDDWSDAFYPPSLKRAEWLSYYARFFNAVELDTTFHATPDAARVRRWAAAVPEDFRFCAKAPRGVTHDVPLDRAAEPMRLFLDVIRGLGTKLSAVLLQFPPSFSAEGTGKLETFLSALPRDVRYAVELRNRSWGTRRTLDLLKEHGCALVAAEYLARPRRVFVTADFLYVRWVGQHGRYEHHAAEQADMTDSLQWWAGALQPALPAVGAVYGFFNNDYAGYAVGTCNRFKSLIGLPAPVRPENDRQGKLFG